jgi:hypothetical protein
MNMPSFSAEESLGLFSQENWREIRLRSARPISPQLRKVPGGPGTGYTCDGAICTCTGDEDCNDMFSSGVCGDIAQCRSEGGFEYCWCLRF